MKFERKPEIAIGERQVPNERGSRTVQKLISESAGKLLHGLETGVSLSVSKRRLRDLNRKIKSLKRIDPSGETVELLAQYRPETSDQGRPIED